MLTREAALLTWDLTDLVSWKPLTEAEATRATVTRSCMNIVRLMYNETKILALAYQLLSRGQNIDGKLNCIRRVQLGVQVGFERAGSSKRDKRTHVRFRLPHSRTKIGLRSFLGNSFSFRSKIQEIVQALFAFASFNLVFLKSFWLEICFKISNFTIWFVTCK